MPKFKKGNIIAEKVEALVCTVNCVGVMGRGVALDFKKAFPENFKFYASECKKHKVCLGKMLVFETGKLENPRFIINFPTKNHWRNKSKIDDIDAGLEDLVKIIQKYKIRSIAVPPLGSGLGGLEWDQVQPRIVKALDRFKDRQVVVFEPLEQQNKNWVAHSSKVPPMTTGRAALMGLMHQYLCVLLDPFITLLEVHKLMYFMQVAGEPLNLKYTKRFYGPYAKNLRGVLNEINGYFINGYLDDRDAPNEPLELVPGAVGQARSVLKQSADTEGRFDRVVDLVSGFESSFGLELLATAHWVLEQEAPESREDVVARIYNWNRRKKLFTQRQILTAVDVLIEKGWVDGSILRGN